MKRTVLWLNVIALLCLAVGVLNALMYFDAWENQILFLKDLEFFTFVIDHIVAVLAFIFSIKLIMTEKSALYLITLFLPILTVILNWYFFYARLIDQIFS